MNGDDPKVYIVEVHNRCLVNISALLHPTVSLSTTVLSPSAEISARESLFLEQALLILKGSEHTVGRLR